jgi:hypothetical protein
MSEEIRKRILNFRPIGKKRVNVVKFANDQVQLSISNDVECLEHVELSTKDVKQLIAELVEAL